MRITPTKEYIYILATSKLVISTKKNISRKNKDMVAHIECVSMVNCDWLSHEHPHPTERKPLKAGFVVAIDFALSFHV